MKLFSQCIPKIVNATHFLEKPHFELAIHILRNIDKIDIGSIRIRP